MVEDKENVSCNLRGKLITLHVEEFWDGFYIDGYSELFSSVLCAAMRRERYFSGNRQLYRDRRTANVSN